MSTVRVSGSTAAGVAAAVTVVCVLPAFLTGGMAVQMSAELGLTLSTLGVAVSSFIAAQAVLSRLLGGWVDRLGAGPALRAAAVLGAVSSFAVAGLAQGLVGLALALAVAGVSNALGQPAASRMLARSVVADRQGIAFGFFQSSKPVAGLLGGLAVPLFALTVGWRWAFVATGCAALLVAAAIPRLEGRPAASATPRRLRDEVPVAALALLAIGMALGFGAVKVFGTFLVEANVTAGLRPALAGLLLSVGGALAIVARLVLGRMADGREGHQLRLVVGMLLAGAIGFGVLALQRPVAMVVGTTVVAVGAWGYNGLFYLSMTRLTDAAGAITGTMLGAASIGGAVAPVLFGLVVDRGSYTVGWLMTGSWVLLAAVVMHLAYLRLEPSPQGPRPPDAARR